MESSLMSRSGSGSASPAQCKMSGCSRELFADGYCGPHYKRKWRHGDPAGVRPFRDESLQYRLRRQYVIRADGCWEWIGTKDRIGYGKVYWQGKGYRAHRLSYQVATGRDASELDHTCRFKACVNPEHLEPVTHSENLRRHYASVIRCPKGHLYDEGNTYRDTAGKRRCRTCLRERQRARRSGSPS